MFAAHLGGVIRDPFFSSVSLLLHCNGANGSTTFVDSSLYAHAMTARNTAAVTTSSPIMGSGSALMTAVNDTIITPAHSSLSFGSGDFTLEILYKSAAHSRPYPVVICNGNFGYNKWQICDRHSSLYPTKFTFNVFNCSPSSPLLVSSTTVNDDTVYALAVCRTSNTFRFFVNGALEDTQTFTGSLDTGSGDVVYIGADATQTGLTTINGREDEVRLTKGVGRYVSNFMVPTGEFTNG